MKTPTPLAKCFRAALVMLAAAAAFGTHAQNDARAQQQRQQQDQARQQQQEQMRRQQEESRRQMQEQQRQQMRQQQQEQMRQQMREQQQSQAREQMAQQRRDQQRQLQQESARQSREEQRRQGAADARRQAQDQQKQLQKNQAAQASRQGTWQAAQGSASADRRSFSNGVAKLNRQPTPGEAKRGFTGKVTADGKALVKFQGRIYSVPASRIGVRAPQAATSQAALATRWTPQKQASISGEIQKLALGGAGKLSGGGSGGSCDPKKSLSCNFHIQASKPGEVVKVSSPDIQARIDKARTAREYTSVAGAVDRPRFYSKSTGEIVPATGYRHISSSAPYLKDLIATGKIPASKAGTYFTFDSIDSGAKDKLQVPHDAAIRLEFDTNQVLDDVRVPQGEYGRGEFREPITKDYKEFGSGGATQAITNKEISVDRIIDIRTGKVLYEKK